MNARPLLAIDGDAYGGRFSPPDADEIDIDMARHEVFEAVAKLYRLLPRETAHWIATSAIIAGEREAARNAQ